MALGGVASVIFGIILLVASGAGALALIWLIAAYAAAGEFTAGAAGLGRRPPTQMRGTTRTL
jgi:uncharacterized membrane protein HdeD (DUF308 family)